MVHGIISELSIIKNIQYGSITISNGSTTNTDTITSVVTGNSLLLSLGRQTSISNNESWDDICAYLTLTNSTTITATRGHDVGSVIVSFCIIEFHPDIIKSNQSGTIYLDTSSTTNTETISEVDTSKYTMSFLGFKTDAWQRDDSDETEGIETYITLTNSTTITANRKTAPGMNGDDVTVSYQIIEFY